jgi:tetratricopeptide (TPR) repeat protein
MTQRFFISHSSQDKLLAIDLHSRLSGDAWVDLFEIDTGDILLEEIAKGIEGATDFVLLWSRYSSQSRWVKFEFHMAFILWIEKRDIALRIICLDDEPLPLYFRPFLQLRDSDPLAIATALAGGPPRIPSPRRFFNRNEEIDAIERTLYSATEDLLWIMGMPGIGKRSLVETASQRIGGEARRFYSVALTDETGPTEFNLKLSSSLSAEISGVRNIPDTNTDNVALVYALARANGILILEDTQRWLEDDATPNSDLLPIFDAIRQAGGPAANILCILLSTRRPKLNAELHARSRQIHVNGLTSEYGAALLESRGVAADRPQLEEASRQLDGHPLALELASANFATTADNWESARVRMASELIGLLPISGNGVALLETIAIVDGPLDAEGVAQVLNINAEQFQETINECVSYGLLGDGTQPFLQIHPLIRDFFVRSFRRHPDVDYQLGLLADASLRMFHATEPGSPNHIASLLSTFRLLGLSGRFDEAIALRSDLSGVLFETARQLYQEQRYTLALSYFNELLTSQYRHLDVQLYIARCLAREGDLDGARSMTERLLSEDPDNSHILRVRGRVEFIARNWPAAARYFELALRHGRRYPPLLRDLAQARIRSEDWPGARIAVEGSLESGDENPFGLNLYSQVLEHDGQLAEARQYMERAVRLDPTNSPFHHRLGRISEQEGDLSTALAEYRRALELNPENGESLLSFASVAIDLGELPAAADAIRRLRNLPHPERKSIVLNITAKLQMAEGEIARAQSTILDALQQERGLFNLSLAARIEIAAIRSGLVSADIGRRRIREWIEELKHAGHPAEASFLESAIAEL